MTFLELMWTFFYIGLFTIGGGQVAITLMYQPIVGRGLLTAEQFYNMVAVSEATPGPIGINMATYVGCELYGILGGIATTFSTVLPSLVIIMVIARFFNRMQNTPVVKSVLSMVRPVSAGLIAVAAWQVFRISVIKFPIETLSVPNIILYVCAFCILLKTKVSPVLMIIAGAFFGVLFL